MLKENFVGLESIIGEYSKPQQDDSEESGEFSGSVKLGDLSGLNKKHLESVSQDFSFNYKQKADLIAKEIKQQI